MDAEQISKGICAYRREQLVFIRLLRKRKTFTERDFDGWFIGREFRRPIRMRPLDGNTFILGIGRNGGNMWAEMLDLLQQMIRLDLVEANTIEGRVIYSLPEAGGN